MTVEYVPELKVGPFDGLMLLPPPNDDGWEEWHDAYVDALNSLGGHQYLKLTDEIPDNAVLVDRRGVFYTKGWDGQDEYDEHYPEAWTWNANILRIEGWDPDRFIITGPPLGIDEWQELVDEDTMPLRRAVPEDMPIRRKYLAQDEGCGAGGRRRGRTVVSGSYNELKAFIKEHWSGVREESPQ